MTPLDATPAKLIASTKPAMHLRVIANPFIGLSGPGPLDSPLDSTIPRSLGPSPRPFRSSYTVLKLHALHLCWIPSTLSRSWR
ncbi:hypothetical protein CspHIS471_0511530 [Cutaneotrichosporon sp. HIS471]|nr:hypothetical protein CspHIS471_0511530 [Cutaneotrichosporon sp. HIS471]